jgi:phosphoglycolate phosphatase
MNSVDKIVHCMQIAAAKSNIEVPSALHVRQIVGISLVPAIQQLFNLTDKATAEALALLYKDAYRECGHISTPLFNGIPELLARLHADEKISL